MKKTLFSLLASICIFISCSEETEPVLEQPLSVENIEQEIIDALSDGEIKNIAARLSTSKRSRPYMPDLLQELSNTTDCQGVSINHENASALRFKQSYDNPTFVYVIAYDKSTGAEVGFDIHAKGPSSRFDQVNRSHFLMIDNRYNYFIIESDDATSAFDSTRIRRYDPEQFRFRVRWDNRRIGGFQIVGVHLERDSEGELTYNLNITLQDHTNVERNGIVQFSQRITICPGDSLYRWPIYKTHELFIELDTSSGSPFISHIGNYGDYLVNGLRISHIRN